MVRKAERDHACSEDFCGSHVPFPSLDHRHQYVDTVGAPQQLQLSTRLREKVVANTSVSASNHHTLGRLCVGI